jgi:amidase
VACGVPDAHGGNMDCKIITEGTTLYLPVNVPGALLALGDLHAAMGDGEVSVCGMEIAGEVTVRVSVIRDRVLPTPMAQTADTLYTIASSRLLDDAANLAARNMASFVASEAGLSTDDAVNLLSVAGNLQICQVVDPQKTCRYALPKSIAEQLGISL